MSRTFFRSLASTGAVVASLVAPPALAEYPGFGSSYICNGYPEASGEITRVAATTTYDSTQGVYLQLRAIDGRYHGGVIYPRGTQDWAYNHMVRMAMLAQAMQLTVRICFSGSEVYAIEMSR